MIRDTRGGPAGLNQRRYSIPHLGSRSRVLESRQFPRRVNCPARAVWYRLPCCWHPIPHPHLLHRAPRSSYQHQLHLCEIHLHKLTSAHPSVLLLRRVVESKDSAYIVTNYCKDGGRSPIPTNSSSPSILPNGKPLKSSVKSSSSAWLEKAKRGMIWRGIFGIFAEHLWFGAGDPHPTARITTRAWQSPNRAVRHDFEAPWCGVCPPP